MLSDTRKRAAYDAGGAEGVRMEEAGLFDSTHSQGFGGSGGVYSPSSQPSAYHSASSAAAAAHAHMTMAYAEELFNSVFPDLFAELHRSTGSFSSPGVGSGGFLFAPMSPMMLLGGGGLFDGFPGCGGGSGLFGGFPSGSGMCSSSSFFSSSGSFGGGSSTSVRSVTTIENGQRVTRTTRTIVHADGREETTTEEHVDPVAGGSSGVGSQALHGSVSLPRLTSGGGSSGGGRSNIDRAGATASAASFSSGSFAGTTGNDVADSGNYVRHGSFGAGAFGGGSVGSGAYGGSYSRGYDGGSGDFVGGHASASHGDSYSSSHSGSRGYSGYGGSSSGSSGGYGASYTGYGAVNSGVGFGGSSAAGGLRGSSSNGASGGRFHDAPVPALSRTATAPVSQRSSRLAPEAPVPAIAAAPAASAAPAFSVPHVGRTSTFATASANARLSRTGRIPGAESPSYRY